MKNTIPKLIKDKDGVVHRIQYCQCGHNTYRKNMKTGAISILSYKSRPNDPKYTVITPVGDPVTLKIKCPECEIADIVVCVNEEMCISDCLTSSVE